MNKDNDPKIDVLRVTPTDAIYDFTCMNDSIGTLWSYKIINTGKEAIDSLKFTLIQSNNKINAINPNNLRFLSLIPISSIQISKNGLISGVDTVTIQRLYSLCTDIVPDALHRMDVSLTDFLKTDTLYISFRTVRCSSGDTALFNVNKNYNQWSFDSLEVFSPCGVNNLVTTTTGLMTGTTLSVGKLLV
ncbi:MAG: hypothetical protein IPP71_23440 [Bacteroidetes bacterium]|nr:hypothetical protein [Bacteroidota bacterium]